jgi:hypothetical protein
MASLGLPAGHMQAQKTHQLMLLSTHNNKYSSPGCAGTNQWLAWSCLQAVLPTQGMHQLMLPMSNKQYTAVHHHPEHVST